MQRFLLIGLLAATGTLHAAAKAKPPVVHEQIAGYAAIIGNNLLAQDIRDEHGLLLVRFARALKPTGNTALLAMGLVERGKNPDPVATQVTEAKLYSVIADQGHALRLREWPSNAKAGRLALLYYRMAERARPDDAKIMLGLMKLRVHGLESDLERALAQASDLKDVFGHPEKPQPLLQPELAKIDRDIGKYSGIWATNRLAADPQDNKGLLLLRLAAHLEPEDDTVLLTLALLERAKKPEAVKTNVSEETLLNIVISRAAMLYAEKDGKKADAGRLSLLYLRAAERFRPEDKRVILGLMKHKVAGANLELDELLASGPSVAAAPLAAKPKPPAGVPLPQPGASPWTVDGLGMELLPIKAGSFTMGSRTDRKAMAHEVTLTKAFWLGKYEVTQAQYEHLMGENPSQVKGPNLPVEKLSGFTATEFCAKLTARERQAHRLPKGYEYRLPTEAEWEYSCRAGTQTAYSFGDAAGELADYAWYERNTTKKTHEVCLKKPNPWGLYDMHGNVWEWCVDGFAPYADGAATDPVAPDAGFGRVCRGGSAWNMGRECGAGHRHRVIGTSVATGFRVALAPALAAAEEPERRLEATPAARAIAPRVREKFEPPREWVEFAEKRDKLPVEEQLLLIAEEFKRLHGGKYINMGAPKVEDGKVIALSFPNNRTLEDLSPLYGLQLHDLRFEGCSSVVDLAPLHGMPLTFLSLRKTRVRSLLPLQGMKLTGITLFEAKQVRSLEGLEEAELTELNLFGLGSLQDIEPLRGMKITKLTMVGPQLRSLDPLKGMPLVEITVPGDRFLGDEDHRILESIPTLETVQTGDEVRDLRITRAIAKLREKMGSTPEAKPPPTVPRQIPEAWVEFATKRDKLPAEEQIVLIADELKKYGHGRDVKLRHEITDGQITTIDLNSNPLLTSIAPLYGLPLLSLDLAKCPALGGDLSALSDMRLTSLRLTSCKSLTSLAGIESAELTELELIMCVALRGDLSALKGMQLTLLDLKGCTSLSSLNGIQQMPLKYINVHFCRGLSQKDYLMLENIATLETVLAGNPERSERILQATKKLREELAAKSPETPGAKPAPTVPRQIPEAWIEFAKKRDKLPAGEQIVLIADELKKHNLGNAVKLKHKITDGEISTLSLKANRQLTSIAPLYGLQLLRLDLGYCEALAGDLSALSGMPLTHLNLHACRKLESLHGIEGAQLTELDCEYGGELKGDLSALKGMPLTWLNLSSCSKLESLRGIEDARLTQLLCEHNAGLTGDLSMLKGMPLETLNLDRCTNLSSLNGVQELPLKTIIVPHSKQLGDGDYQMLGKIPTLEIAKTGNAVRDLRILAATKKLREGLASKKP